MFYQINYVIIAIITQEQRLINPATTMKTSWHYFQFCAWYLMSVFQFLTYYMYMQEISNKFFFHMWQIIFIFLKYLTHEEFVTNYFHFWKICDKFFAIFDKFFEVFDKFVSNFWQTISEFNKLFMTFDKLFAICDKSFIWHISGIRVKTLVSGRRRSEDVTVEEAQTSNNQ